MWEAVRYDAAAASARRDCKLLKDNNSNGVTAKQIVQVNGPVRAPRGKYDRDYYMKWWWVRSIRYGNYGRNAPCLIEYGWVVSEYI